jgi:hypothetical protein
MNCEVFILWTAAENVEAALDEDGGDEIDIGIQ